MNTIKRSCHISNNRIIVDGQLVFEAGASMALAEFTANAYRNGKFNYAKFFKMDMLCKLAFVASEYLLQQEGLIVETERSRTGIVLSNRASSLDTDRVHASSIKDKANYFPSPAVFVYTLPNIMIGEISIRHKLTGENSFFVTPEFDAELISSYINQLLDEGLVTSCIGGWVELDGTSYEAFLYLATPESVSEKNSNFSSHSKQGILELLSPR
jgi:hypothetical protein